MALTLQTPQYTPPTGYAIIGGGAGGVARSVYDCVEAVKRSKWFSLQAEYGITRLDWRGCSPGPACFGDGVIHIVLASFDRRRAFGTEWAAYHGDDNAGLCYAWCPTTGVGLEQLTVYVTHELTEALLDSPPGAGWVNLAQNDEDADDCEQQADLLVAGFHVSPYWSNALGRCITQGDL